MKSEANPMHLTRQERQVQLMQAAGRCSATSKRSRCRCLAPAVRGKSVCRMHGARAGAPKGKANGAWRHGRATNAAKALRAEFADLVATSRRHLKDMMGE